MISIPYKRKILLSLHSIFIVVLPCLHFKFHCYPSIRAEYWYISHFFLRSQFIWQYIYCDATLCNVKKHNSSPFSWKTSCIWLKSWLKLNDYEWLNVKVEQHIKNLQFFPTHCSYWMHKRLWRILCLQRKINEFYWSVVECFVGDGILEFYKHSQRFLSAKCFWIFVLIFSKWNG